MPRYIEVVSAARETATKLLALRQQGRKYSVVVTTEGGATASVEWTVRRVTLNMPSLPPDALLTRGEADRMVAFIGHECCHVLHSDKAAWERAVCDGSRVKAWTNALEDVRIERKEIKAGHFPALQSLLAGIANHLHYEAVTEAAKSGRVIGAETADAPYLACILGRVANGYAIPAAGNLRDGMSPAVSRLLDVALAGIRQARSTEDVRQLALALTGMEARQQKPQNDQEDGQEGSQGSQGSQDGQEGSRGSQDGQEGAGPATDADLSGTIQKIAERAGIDDVSAYACRSVNRLTTANAEFQNDNTRDAQSATIAAGMLNARLPSNSILHGQIGRLLVAEEKRAVTHHESSGRLDRRALARMRTGATDVYSRRAETPAIDTALLIVLDGSSSMSYAVNGNRHVCRADLAKTAAWHIAKAAETANAKVAIVGFGRLSLSDPTRLTVLKAWETPIADRAAHLAVFPPLGGTPLSPAILHGARMLSAVNATRHIMMVLTDGEDDYGPEGVQRACTLADYLGVEIVGIGMACASVTAAFPPRYSINVADLQQLAQTGLGVLVRMLEDAAPYAAD